MAGTFWRTVCQFGKKYNATPGAAPSPTPATPDCHALGGCERAKRPRGGNLVDLANLGQSFTIRDSLNSLGGLEPEGRLFCYVQPLCCRSPFSIWY